MPAGFVVVPGPPAEELPTLIRSDYTGHPVPRRSRQAHGGRLRRPGQMRSSRARRPKPGSRQLNYLSLLPHAPETIVRWCAAAANSAC